MNEFEFEIPNFAKYNPRKDVNSTTWFRASNTTFHDSKFGRLSQATKLLWFYYLAEFSRAGMKKVKTSCALVARQSGYRQGIVRNATLELEENQMLVIPWRDAHVPYATNERDERTNETNVSTAPLTKSQRREKLVSESSQNLPQKITKSKSEPAKTAATWESFSNAYRKRYGSDPVKNATTNSQMANFVRRIGAEEAPLVAEFFVSLNDQWYTKQAHAVGALLRDAEKLRTMWANGIRTTTVDAKTAHWREQHRAIEAGEL